MPHYISQWSFTAAQAKALVENPQDREPAARALIEAFGGRLLCYYFMIGERDGVLISEFPDNESAVGCTMRACASGAFAAFESRALMTSAEAQRAMAKARGAAGAYRPPSG
jgi:uncharacterized protein with GYD domain